MKIITDIKMADLCEGAYLDIYKEEVKIVDGKLTIVSDEPEVESIEILQKEEE